MKLLLLILLTLIVFCAGAIGGVWAQAFFLPYAASHAPYDHWPLLQQWSTRTVTISPVQNITISQDQAAANVAQRSGNVVAGVKSVLGNRILTGSGFIYTSQGLVVTLADLVPQGSATTVYAGGKTIPSSQVQVLKRDAVSGLALLKVPGDSFSTASFAGTPSLGMPVVLLARIPSVSATAQQPLSVVHDGLVRSVSTSQLTLTFSESPDATGGPLFDLQGQIVGLSVVHSTGTISVIPVDTLQGFVASK